MIAFVLISFVFTFSTPAQKRVAVPFDFNDDYYLDNGVSPKSMIDRRNGFDKLSVFGKSTNPIHNNVRVTVTVAGYDQNAQPLFWTPLGELMSDGFTDDYLGASARQLASLFPIYVFPEPKTNGTNIFSNTRQAPVFDDSWNMYLGRSLNPLGIREVMIVNYTAKAFGKEGYEMRLEFGKKNGLATDDMPIINCREDIQYLLKSDFITIDSATSPLWEPEMVRFAISPVISNPTRGAITPDAFLWMSLKGNSVLPAEQVFVWQFGCLKKTGDWCQ